MENVNITAQPQNSSFGIASSELPEGPQDIRAKGRLGKSLKSFGRRVASKTIDPIDRMIEQDAGDTHVIVREKVGKGVGTILRKSQRSVTTLSAALSGTLDGTVRNVKEIVPRELSDRVGGLSLGITNKDFEFAADVIAGHMAEYDADNNEVLIEGTGAYDGLLQVIDLKEARNGTLELPFPNEHNVNQIEKRSAVYTYLYKDGALHGRLAFVGDADDSAYGTAYFAPVKA